MTTFSYDQFMQRMHEAIQEFWSVRAHQAQKQKDSGTRDAGQRGAVTAGKQMDSLEALLADVIVSTSVEECEIHRKKALELPGYFRAEKKWDLLGLSSGQLVAAIEFKAQVGPSFGNNLNNRCEEALGSAADIWQAFRTGLLGASPAPFLGYVFLLEDCQSVHRPVKNRAPHFAVDSVFSQATYAQRYELMCRRLVSERQYTAASLMLATDDVPSVVQEPAEDLTLWRFVRVLASHASVYSRKEHG